MPPYPQTRLLSENEITLVEQLRKLSAENRSPRDCIDEAADVIENLAALINRLCRQLNRVAPNNDVTVKAAEYMYRNNLLGTSLRRDDEGVGMVMDTIRNTGGTATDDEEPEWQNDVQAAFGGIVQTPQG
jgi:hypothetical protein